MEKSTVIQVDDATKGIMEEVEDGISSTIEDKVSGMTDELLQKLQSLDSLSMTVNDLRKLAKDTKSLQSAIPPLQTSIDNVAKNTDSANVSIKKQSAEFADINDRLNKLEESLEKILLTQDMIVNLVTPFWKKWGKKKDV